MIGLHMPQTSNPFLVLDFLRMKLGVPFFMEIIVLMPWSIWKTRNGHIFSGMSFSGMSKLKYKNARTPSRKKLHRLSIVQNVDVCYRTQINPQADGLTS